MKQFITYLIIGVVVLASCNPFPRESKRMDAALEQAQLVYGEGENDTLLFIPELDKAASFYAQKKDYGKAALAALYHGYAEMDYDKTTAMEAFKTAEQFGVLVHDSFTVARAQYQTGRLLYNDGMEMEAVTCFSKADVNFKGHWKERALVHNMSASSYILNYNFDSAEIHLGQCLFYANKGNAPEIKQKAWNNYAVMNKLKGDYEKGLAYLRLIGNTSDSTRLALFYQNMGNMYRSMGNMDSTEYYYGLLETVLPKVPLKKETMISSYNVLSKFEKDRGNSTKAWAFRDVHDELMEELQSELERKSIYRIQQQYDHEVLRNQMSKKIIIRQRVIFVLCSLGVLGFVVLALLQIRLAKAHQREAEARELIMQYVHQYNDVLTKQGKTMQKVAMVMEHKNDLALLNDLKATVFGKKDPWTALLEVFDHLHPNKRLELIEQHPELNDLEIKDVILSYFNVSRQDEALMLKMNIHSVDKLRLNVKRKMQKQE